MIRMLSILLMLAAALLGAGDKVLIWEATAPGLPGKVYLAGSIHVGKASWYPLDQAYDRALGAASVVWFEIYRMDRQEAARETLRHGLFREPANLSKVLGFADFQEVCQFYARHSPLRPEMLNRFRPWLLSMQISEFYLRQHPEFRQDLGFEMVFTKNLGDKPGASLETAELQIRAMADLPDTVSGRLLLESVRDFEHAGKDLDRIIHALESGDPTGLAQIANELAFKHGPVYQSLFVDRNRRMTEKIYAMLKQKQTVLVLVGAGHFAGKGNILEMLRDKGCRTIQQDRVGKPGRIRP